MMRDAFESEDRRHLVRQEPGWQKVRTSQPARPTWVEIDLEAIANNVRLLADIAAPAKIMTILKADAYGHGMVKVARTVLNNGASWVGVATLGEAITLRRSGIDAPILVLSYMPAWQAHDAISHNVSATVYTEELAAAFSRAAAELNKKAYVHIKVDSGMGRLGLLPEQVPPFLKALPRSGLVIEGLYTHFATADEADFSYAHEQLRRFKLVLAQLDQAQLRPPLIHAANTAALLNLPEARFDMVRPGIGLYGFAAGRFSTGSDLQEYGRTGEDPAARKSDWLRSNLSNQRRRDDRRHACRLCRWLSPRAAYLGRGPG